MTTKLGRDLQVGDKVIRVDGQVATVTRLTNGMCRDSRIAEFDQVDEHGRLWASVFNKTEYEVVPIRKVR